MKKRSLIATAGVLAAGGAAALAYASLIERFRFQLRRFDVPVLAPDTEPLRILHISDLHLSPNSHKEVEWVASLAALDPDLVVLTGDNLAHPEAVSTVSAALEPLFTYPGVFVFGSNDYYAPVLKNPFTYFNPNREHKYGEELPTEELRKMLTGAGWRDLNNATTTIPIADRTIAVAGVDDPHFDLDDYDLIAGEAPTDASVTLGLTHSPEPRVLDQMAADGYQLLLAGHTHGGQVCVPGYGALVTNCGIDRKRVKGLHRYGSSWLHVSAGLGTSPYAPIRFACHPEASILTLIPRT
ncbi:metallophosphoesterase [Stackebrandtia nassauensis]|uniref:Metallophosphoesterase n=1 Tax=Stackebrandtia nassauensis (strain DSM 44728 / CIP 108903 / NRRL B-16338 / NBRC 102104 / LLR-40K-21) TaxID=446470 RepID=D3Q609_STANL|nr:metallophosphoesterase [Stackebrandtia nassauensis]ADD40308.1 metallophosphoesterase [Stackebrandtia nassauensis DSM 44728]